MVYWERHNKLKFKFLYQVNAMYMYSRGDNSNIIFSTTHEDYYFHNTSALLPSISLNTVKWK